MNTPRRYTEAEIADILKQAAQDQEQARAEAGHDGLTLEELKEAGQAAGIAPAFITRAAASVDASALTPPPRVRLGQHISVAHAVEISGSFTDADWNALVQDARHTFGAHGTVSQSGGSRQWSNGNLRVYVEPGPSGHRLHFYTRHGALQNRIDAGLCLALTAIFVTAVLLIGGDGGALPALGIGGLMALLAAGFYGSSAYQLPRWRRTRKSQMKAIAQRTLDRVAAREDGEAAPAATARSAETNSESGLNLPADAAPSTEAQRPRPGQRTT